MARAKYRKTPLFYDATDVQHYKAQLCSSKGIRFGGYTGVPGIWRGIPN